MTSGRAGFSLFEVMIAMAICVAGLALILQMLGTSETLSRRAELQLRSQQHCRNLLNCFLAGILEPVPTRREELAADSDFWYAVQLDQHGVLPLEVVIVEVWPKTPRERDAGARFPTGDSQRNSDEAKRFRLIGHRPAQRDVGVPAEETPLAPATDGRDLLPAAGSGARSFR